MRRFSEMATFPAPIGGLNVADPLVAMDPKYATVMINMVSQPYGVEMRKGNVRHATDLGGPVKTIVTHTPATTDATLYAFANGDMFDVTDPGDQVRVPELSGLLRDVWNGVGVSNASGFNTTLYNGVDDGIWIHNDGTITRITAAAIPGSPVVGEIDGVDPKVLIGGTVHQKRVWLVQQSSTKAWYLAPEAISGTASMFDFGSIFTMGGYLMALSTWTVDAGEGLDDMLVAISSRGQIAIYKGTDPSGSDTWGLIGVFKTGAPLDMRAVTRVEGDLLIMTQFGLLSLAEAMARSQISGASSEAYLSNKIQFLISELAVTEAEQFGWSVNYLPETNLVQINIPLEEGGSGQLVQSTITKGWSQLQGWDALCWTRFNTAPVYGDRDGNVWRAWEGTTDNRIQSDATTISIGEKIYGTVQTAFNFLANSAVVKHPKLIRPTFVSTDNFDYQIVLNPDFDFDAPLQPGAADGIARSLWDYGLWDVAVWNTHTKQTHHQWTSTPAIGSAFGVRLAFQVDISVLWASFDLLFENGEGI